MRFALKYFAPLLLLASAFGADTTPPLPKIFAGWQQDPASVKTSTDPGDADGSNAAALKEFGFNDVEAATYTKDGNRKLTVRAARFADATGAYGAYTLYSQPGMQTEDIGRHGESAGDRVLFLQGNILVEAKFDVVNAMSAAEMRELASDLPQPRGDIAHPPDLPRWLPPAGFIEHSVKYAVGPKTYNAMGTPLPVSIVDFSKSPEVLTAQYKSDSGIAHLMLISYPTPQIAGTQLRTLQQNLGALNSSGLGDLQIKRSGPLVAMVYGDASPSEARSLLASVNYEAEVTFDEPTFLSKRDNIGNLIVGIFSLIGVILAFALVMGIAFGGVRVVLKRLYPEKFFDRPEDAAVISLNLQDNSSKST